MSIQKARAEIQRLRNKANRTMRSTECYEKKLETLSAIMSEIKELEATIDKWGGFIL